MRMVDEDGSAIASGEAFIELGALAG